jgi:predicted nucleotidyltransferase
MTNNSSNQNCGLPLSAIEKIVKILANCPRLEKAVLYGSRAKGNYRKGSDIDLTLMGKNLTYEDLGKIDNSLDDLLLPYTFDLSLFSHITSSDLIEHIERVGIIFFENNRKTR